MEGKELYSIIDSGEGKQIEFKSAEVLRNPNEKNRYNIATEIVALANRRGGYLVFGVDDETNELEELQLLEDKSRDTISSIASDKCSPPVGFGCYYFNEELEGEYQVFVVEISPKEQLPHAVVDNSEGTIRKREYRIRTGEDSRLVTDSELRSLFTGHTGQRVETGSTTHVPLDLSQRSIKYVDPFPTGLKSYNSFLARMSGEDWDTVVNESHEEEVEIRVQKLLTELFPFAVLDSLPGDFWVHCVEDEYSPEDLDDMFDYFDYNTLSDLDYDSEVQTAHSRHNNGDLIRDTDLLINELDLNPLKVLEQDDWFIHVPTGTQMSLVHIDPYNAALGFQKDAFFDASIAVGGAPSPIQGLQKDHPLSEHVTDQDTISATLATWVEGKFGYPDVEDPHIRENRIFVEAIHEVTDDLWDWDRCLEGSPSIEFRLERRLEQIEDKVDQVLDEG